MSPGNEQMLWSGFAWLDLASKTWPLQSGCTLSIFSVSIPLLAIFVNHLRQQAGTFL